MWRVAFCGTEEVFLTPHGPVNVLFFETPCQLNAGTSITLPSVGEAISTSLGSLYLGKKFDPPQLLPLCLLGRDYLTHRINPARIGYMEPFKQSHDKTCGLTVMQESDSLPYRVLSIQAHHDMIWWHSIHLHTTGGVFF